jgi:hypothetical protein
MGLSVFSTDFELRGADLPFFHAELQRKNVFEKKYFLEKKCFIEVLWTPGAFLRHLE